MKKITFLLLLALFSVSGFSQKALSYKTPKSKADTVAIDLDYTKVCIGKYYEQNRNSLLLYSIGGAVSISSLTAITATDKITSDEKTIYTVLASAGGALILAGIITQIDSFKWLKRAKIYPTLTPVNGGVIINF